MLELCQDIGHRLRKYNLAAKGISIGIRNSELHGESAQCRLPYPSQSPLEIAQAARLLFSSRYSWYQSIRAIVVTAINLTPADQPRQIDLFGDEARRLRQQKLDDCVEEIRRRFGKRAITHASLLCDLHMPSDGRHEVTMPGMMYV